jgi:hypothetical protein
VAQHRILYSRKAGEDGPLRILQVDEDAVLAYANGVALHASTYALGTRALRSAQASKYPPRSGPLPYLTSFPNNRVEVRTVCMVREVSVFAPALDCNLAFNDINRLIRELESD